MPSIGYSSKASITIDVEEYFQVEAFANKIKISDWQNFPSRIIYQMHALLDLLAINKVKATFFILGYIARNHPELIKMIADQGHEIASHGYNHQHITKQTQKEFLQDITDAKHILEDLTSNEVNGYRAPCFSITESNAWAHEEIKNAGYSYSSSTYPIHHDLYGVPNAPRSPYYLDNGLLEIPVSTTKVFNKVLPAGGGGYFRLLPYSIFKMLLQRSEKQLGYINFYTHPWEYDPDQPQINAGFKSNFRHRVNQSSALTKLSNLCKLYHFDTLARLHENGNYPKLSNWNNIAKGKF